MKLTLLDVQGQRILPSCYSDSYVSLPPGEAWIIARICRGPTETLAGGRRLSFWLPEMIGRAGSLDSRLVSADRLPGGVSLGNGSLMNQDVPANIRLNGIDIKILEELQADSTITYRELSARVALSASACVGRVKRLEKLGVILGFHAAIAVERVRPTLLVMAEIVMRKHLIAELDRFDRFLRTRPEVIEIMRVQGPSDYILKLMLSDMRHWRTFAHRLLSPENGVERMVSHLVIEELKTFSGYPLRPQA